MRLGERERTRADVGAARVGSGEQRSHYVRLKGFQQSFIVTPYVSR